MSDEVNVSVDLAVPPEEVWAVVMDPDRLGDWVTIHRKLHGSYDRPLKLGSKLQQTLCLRGASFKVKWTVEEIDDGRVAVWEGRGPARSKATTRYELSPADGGGTHFRYSNQFKAPLGPLGAAASRALVGGLPEKEAKASLQQLKSLLDAK